MDDRLVECATCATLVPEPRARNIPLHVADQDAYIDGYYCETHAAAALEAVRSHIAGLDLEDDERDDMMPLMLLMAHLRRRGMMVESLAPDEAGGEGMEHIRQQVLAQLRRLAAGERLPIDEATALCSGCYRPVLASQVHVIPCHNDGPDDYVTSFRCAACWKTSLAETRARLEHGSDRDVARLCEFLGRHTIVVHEHRRGDPPATVRPIVLQVLDMIAAGSIKLQIGETVPLAEALAHGSPPPSPTPPPSPPAPANPPPAAAAKPSLWQRLFGRKEST